MMGQRRRRWPIITPALGQRLMLPLLRLSLYVSSDYSLLFFSRFTGTAHAPSLMNKSWSMESPWARNGDNQPFPRCDYITSVPFYLMPTIFSHSVIVKVTVINLCVFIHFCMDHNMFFSFEFSTII